MRKMETNLPLAQLQWMFNLLFFPTIHDRGAANYDISKVGAPQLGIAQVNVARTNMTPPSFLDHLYIVFGNLLVLLISTNLYKVHIKLNKNGKNVHFPLDILLYVCQIFEYFLQDILPKSQAKESGMRQNDLLLT
ncbi:hypothetical protein KC19_10G127300 [Ceratodon purpureus]|uniref:Uncharacterized protein n=1 Tax=Ceratodon purpureus TaxID=3225 RepID=A0A8T0GLA5_CERPU|nr:hypothetical protein KC19_10G127300 [Ceratodon purpureus]